MYIKLDKQPDKYDQYRDERKLRDKMVGGKRMENIKFKCKRCGRNNLSYDQVIVFSNTVWCKSCSQLTSEEAKQ